MHIYLEIFTFNTRSDYELTYLHQVIDLTQTPANPDNIVSKYLQTYFSLTEHELEQDFIIHSTSWHYDQPNQIYLTYLAYAQCLELEKRPGIKSIDLASLKVAEGLTYRARPEVLDEMNIFSHGLRHLNSLIRYEQEYTQRMHPDAVKFFNKLDSALAGKL